MSFTSKRGFPQRTNYRTKVHQTYIHLGHYRRELNLKIIMLNERGQNKKVKSERGFPGGPVVKNPSFNARDIGWIPGQGTKTQTPQLEGLCSAAEYPVCRNKDPACRK